MSLSARDLKHIWHPCMQMKDFESIKLLEVVRASSCKIELRNGKKIIDAISSWWCKSLGHQHPRLQKALKEQLEKFEHVIFANTTHEIIVQLAEKLSQLTQTLNKVFFASDGSSAIEIALKMSLHARKIQGEPERHLFLALANGYHGETLGALSVSDLGLYREPYDRVLFEAQFLSPLPYVANSRDPLWNNCETHWNQLLPTLEKYAQKTTAIVVEPLVQGASGMKIYSQDLLKRLRQWTKDHNIHLIADEIMTGMGRTGRMLACEHAEIEPDFLCLAKGLTGGCLPLSAVLTRQSIFDLFYDDYETGKAFLHSHTQSGNALAASVALETLNIFVEENICAQVRQLEKIMHESMLEIAEETKKITHVRSLGAIVAADLTSQKERAGFAIAQSAIEKGALLRPLGNTIYWFPPLNIDLDSLGELKKITRDVILSVNF